MKDIIVIVGPTGVGKTKLSVELAKKLDAEIINGDSVAIYKELDIGSAKPTINERESIPHHLLDIKDVREEYSVFDYQKDVRKLIEEISSRGKRIIIVGGTGLYIKAALYNYEFTSGTTTNQYEELSNNEPVTNKKDQLLYPCKVIGLTTERSKLYDRINNRVDQMINNGLLDEIISLKEKYPTSRILNSGIGYKEFYDYLYNSKPLDEVIAEIKQDSRRYAKRQYTFFKHQFNTTWFDVNFNDFNQTIEEVYNYIKEK